jgi:hypothetical protein
LTQQQVIDGDVLRIQPEITAGSGGHGRTGYRNDQGVA